MPPWGAVKGFGNFRNEQGLTQEQISLIADWVEGGVTQGQQRARAAAGAEIRAARLRSSLPTRRDRRRG